MGACDTCVGCGIEVAANGALKVDLQTGGGIICDLTDPTVNDQTSGLYLNVDGTSVTTKPDGIVRAQLAQTGLRRTGTASLIIPPDGFMYQFTPAIYLPTTQYDLINGVGGASPATQFRTPSAAHPAALATIPSGGAGLYEWSTTAGSSSAAATAFTCRFIINDQNGVNTSGVFDMALGLSGNMFASMGPWPLAEGATVEVGFILAAAQSMVLTNPTFMIARIGN